MKQILRIDFVFLVSFVVITFSLGNGVKGVFVDKIWDSKIILCIRGKDHRQRNFKRMHEILFHRRLIPAMGARNAGSVRDRLLMIKEGIDDE